MKKAVAIFYWKVGNEYKIQIEYSNIIGKREIKTAEVVTGDINKVRKLEKKYGIKAEKV